MNSNSTSNPTTADFSALFEALADLFDQGNEPIAKVASTALRRHVNSTADFLPHALKTSEEIKTLLQISNALLCADLISPVMDDLSWHYSGLEDGRISETVARRMQTVEIIGADGMIYDDTCRVGLFSQTANTDYIIRTHAAEELFVQIAGEAEWMKGDEPYLNRHAGDRMHHASYQPHASRTKQSAMIAAWVWAGDLDYSKYNYTG